MKYNSKTLVILFTLATMSLCSFYSCKGKECTGRVLITVVDEASGARVPVPECNVVFGDPSFAPNVYREVVTDENGRYEGVWQNEAYLKVEASKMLHNKMYKGSSSIRLSLGEITEQEILIKVAQ
ncbi:MAG: hypothetical protein J5701_00300 [Bacteroidales bacterium]|nr:hypothetical protein [Bacteroidales bacterium]